jgi:hypothetical protein
MSTVDLTLFGAKTPSNKNNIFTQATQTFLNIVSPFPLVVKGTGLYPLCREVAAA